MQAVLQRGGTEKQIRITCRVCGSYLEPEEMVGVQRRGWKMLSIDDVDTSEGAHEQYKCKMDMCLSFVQESLFDVTQQKSTP